MTFIKRGDKGGVEERWEREGNPREKIEKRKRLLFLLPLGIDRGTHTHAQHNRRRPFPLPIRLRSWQTNLKGVLLPPR